MTQQLADSIKRLRGKTPPECLGIQTINQLVDLVAEMHKVSMVVWKTNNPQTKEENKPLVELRDLVTKSAPIAQLKEK